MSLSCRKTRQLFFGKRALDLAEKVCYNNTYILKTEGKLWKI